MRRHGKHLAALAAALAALLGAASAEATSVTRTASFAYDPASGLLTQEAVAPGTPSLSLQTGYTYDAFGNKIGITTSGVDIVTRSSSAAYDGRGQFALSITNALNQSESWTYDPRFGTPTSHTGPNGLTTTWAYDTFGRKTQEVRPDGTQTQYAYLFCSGLNGGSASCPANAAYLVQATPYAADGATQNGPRSTIYYDTLNRPVASDTQGFDASTIRQTWQYDALGRMAQKSKPYFLATGTPVLTTFSYDALGRIVTITFADGSTSQKAYHGLTVTATNRLGQSRTTVRNDQGLAASMTDSLGQVLSYAYDPFGNLVRTTDPAGNIATYTYDTLGRRIAMSDPDMGAWSYAYDTLSELKSQTDAKGQTTTFAYDVLGRLVQRVEPDMVCQWTYDTAAMGIGKLAAVGILAGPSNGYSKVLSYDSLGRRSQTQITLGGTTYTMTTGYDANSRVSTATYPSGFTLNHLYTPLGDLSQLTNAATGLAYWTANAMDARLRVTEETAGNGIVTEEAYDAASGRLTSVQAGLSGAPGGVENFAYTYDKLGNPLSRADGIFELSESFTYDALNRLTSATVAGGPAKSFSYDALGDLTAKSDVGTYTYPAAGLPQPHAVSSIAGGALTTSFAYDANGNLTSGAGRTIGYTSFNQVNSIAQGTTGIAFTHGPDHQRLTQTAPAGTTIYLGDGNLYVELFTGAGSAVQWNEYLSNGREMVGVRFNNVTGGTVSTRYFHGDHLGSISVLTDENANVVQRLSYDAWGKQRVPSTWADDTTDVLPTQDQTTRGFTGQEQLLEVGLVHMNGRVYDPFVARFASVDPIINHPRNLQSYNGYSYVRNTPLKLRDPSGFDDIDLDFDFDDFDDLIDDNINSSLSSGDGPSLSLDTPIDPNFDNFAPSSPTTPAAASSSVSLSISAAGGSAIPNSVGSLNNCLNTCPAILGVSGGPLNLTLDPIGLALNPFGLLDPTNATASTFAPISTTAASPSPIDGFGADTLSAAYYNNFLAPGGVPGPGGAKFANGAATRSFASISTTAGASGGASNNGPIIQVAQNDEEQELEKLRNFNARAFGGTETLPGGEKVRVPLLGGGGPPASSFSGNKLAPLQAPTGLSPRNEPGEFNGVPYSGHAFDQLQNRGIPPSVSDQALREGQQSPGNVPGTTTYYDPVNKITVVRNASGKVITVRPGPP